MVERRSAAVSPAAPNPVRARFGAFELDEANARLLRDGKALALAPTPFALLCALARQPGSLLTKNALLDQVWGHRFVSESVLKTAISDLRAALDDDPRHPRFIETVSRRGYRFVAGVAAVPAAPAPQASVPGAGAEQTPSFVGRQDALAALRRAWESACSGRRTIVWVAGEPGIGKTTLIEHFVASLGDVACARGQCVEQYGEGEPYLPVLEALAERCRIDGTAPALLRSVAPAWLLQLPWLCTVDERDALRRELAGVSPDRMLREAGELFDRYAEGRPLLLVTEDLHWSDRSTIQLVDYVARRRGGARFMWLASFRLAEVVALDHPLNSLRHELRLHGLCEEIVLDPFSESEVAEYVAQRSPVLAGDEAFVRALHERTDGMPLFVAAVAREVAARGLQGGADAAPGARLANLAVPENLAAIVDRYIARLDDEERALLSAAAACGVEFRIGTVADALDRDAAAVEETCERLARGQLWLATPRGADASDSPEQPCSFRHALFRQVLYEHTPAATRVRLHRRVGAALERERAAGVAVAAAELAIHFERGREPLAAMRYCVEAAEAALSHLSPPECASLAERGLALLSQAPPGAARDALEIELATLQGVSASHLLGVGSTEAKSAFERAAALLGREPRHRMRGLLLHDLGFLLCMRAEYAEAVALAAKAEALSTANGDPILLLGACTAQGEVNMAQGRPRAAREWCERGLAAAAALGESHGGGFVADPQVTLLALLAMQLLNLGLIGQARERLRQAHAQAQRAGQPMARLVAHWFDALAEVRLGDAGRVAALADEMRALVEEFALAQGRTACRWFRGWAEARMGDPREAHLVIRDAYEDNIRLGMLAGASENMGYAAEALLLAGDLDAARRQLGQALEFVEAHQERIYLPQLLLIEAAIARERGETAVADTSARRAVAEARAQEAPWLELVTLLELCKTGGASADDRRALAALVEALPEAAGTTAAVAARALLDGTRSR